MRRDYPDELEADFQQYYGLDIATTPSERAARLLFQLPKTCRTFLKINPQLEWGWTEQLLNECAYALDLLVWTKTEDAMKKHPTSKPEKFVPPFMPKPKKDKDSVAMDIDDVKAFLTRPRN